MSVLASRLDRASETYRANRSANLRLLEELAEQFPQTRAGSERYVPATGTRYRAVRLAEGLAGAAMTNQFLLEESPWLPLALLVVAAVIAWARRSSNSILVDMLRR